jgi:hypothetical protein
MRTLYKYYGDIYLVFGYASGGIWVKKLSTGRTRVIPYSKWYRLSRSISEQVA